MDKLIQEIINWVRITDKRIIIGISGHGAAGKTTFANKLVNRINENEVNYLNTDPYIISSSLRKNTMIDYTYENENHRYKMTACLPAAHHLPSLERDIQMVRDGFDLYTIDTNYMKSELIQSKNRITIVEGMSVAFINPNLSDGETEFLRRSNRDIIERGTDINYLNQSHTERRIQYEVFMHPFSEHFDIIFKTSKEGIHLEKDTFKFIK